MTILQIPSIKVIFFTFFFFLKFVNTKSIPQKEVKVIETILFRSSDGEAFNGYLQTTDSRPLTVYCEATSVYSDITYEIRILHQTNDTILQIIGRSVTFTPPLDLVIQCRAKVSIPSANNYVDSLLIVKGQPPVRLTGGQQPNEGILQVLWNNTWSSVAQEGFASTAQYLKQNGAVLCRTLGFSGFFKSMNSEVDPLKKNNFSEYLVKFECSGKENNIHNCNKTNLKTNAKTTFQPARITCQSSHMLAPNQNAVQVSEKKDIRVQIQVLPLNRSIYVTENVTVKCFLQFQLPRFHVIKLFAQNSGKKRILHSKIARVTMINRLVQIELEYNITASLENSNTTFICQGMDNISQVYKEISETLIFKQILTNIDVIPDPQKCTYSFQCAVNAKHPVQRSWRIYYFDKTEESNVSQNMNLSLSCEQVLSIEKICCSGRQKIYTASSSSDKCFDMRLHASSKLSQTFTTLGFSGPYGILQRFKVPLSGCYEIVAKGARGGDYKNMYVGGYGAKVIGKMDLVQEAVYTVVVGQAGENSVSNIGAGGGGASVVYYDSKLLTIAGGGSGADSKQNGNPGNNDTMISSVSCPYNKQKFGFGAGWQSQDFVTSTVSISPANSRSKYWLGGAKISPNTANDGGFGGGGAGISWNNREVAGGGGGFIGGEAYYCHQYGNYYSVFSGGGSSKCLMKSCKVIEGGNRYRDGEVRFKYLSKTC